MSLEEVNETLNDNSQPDLKLIIRIIVIGIINQTMIHIDDIVGGTVEKGIKEGVVVGRLRVSKFCMFGQQESISSKNVQTHQR